MRLGNPSRPIYKQTTVVILSLCFFLSWPVSSEDKTPADNADLHDLQQFFVGALDTGVVAGLVPIGAVSRPGELIEISTNLALKAIAPQLTIPDDLFLSPNGDLESDELTTGRSCYRDFVLPHGFSQEGSAYTYPYEDWFGFWNITKLPLPNEWYDFGTPTVKHANSAALLSLQLFGDVNDDPNIITLPEGRYTVDWTATTQISLFWDVALPVYLAIPNLNAESRYGEAVVKKAAKKSAKEAGKLRFFLGQVSERVARTAGLKFANYAVNNGLPPGTDGFFIGVVTDSEPTVSNRAQQSITIYDVHTPLIATNSSSVVAEARNFGGSFFSRVEDDLIATLTYFDLCDKAVQLTNNAPSFLPIGETIDITWTVSDGGFYHPDYDETASITQSVTIEDTQGPILVPPAGFAIYSDSDIDTTSDEFELGAALVADLADPNPTVSNDLPVLLERDRRYTVNYSATDATGNITQATVDDPDAYTQIITIKSPGTNTIPAASTAQAETLTSQPVTIQLSGSDTDIIDDIPDPLAFRIADRPENGEFVAPLFPYFIEDYRLQPDEPITGDITVENLSCPADSEDGKQLEAKLGLLERIYHKAFIEKCYCDSAGASDPPDNFVYKPQYIYIDDDETLYVTDFEWFCGGGGHDGQTRKRIAKFLDDELQDKYVSSNAPEDIFQVDGEGNIWYNIIVGTDELKVNGLDQDLSVISDEAGAGDYRSSTLSNAEHGLTMDARNLVRTHVDKEREVIYVNDKSRIYMFDYYDPSTYLGAVRDGEEFLRDNCGSFSGSSKGYWMDTDSEGNLYQVCESHVHKIGPPQLVDGVLEVGEYIGWMGLCSGNKTDPDTGVPYNYCNEETQTSRGFQCTDDTCDLPEDQNDKYGDGPGQFRALRHFDVGPDDILYMADTGNRRIQRFSPDGTFAGEAKSTGDGVTEDGSFVLGNMGSPQHVSVNSTEFHVLEGDNSTADFFLHVFKTLPFYDVTNDSAKVDYVSDLNFQGTDQFTFVVDDGIDTSETALVEIEVNRAFRAPENLIASCFSDIGFTSATACELEEDTVLYIRLTADDLDGFLGFGGLDELTFTIDDDVSNGTLAVIETQANRADYSYTPNENYFGEDAFVFSVNDGVETSESTVSVDLTIEPTNDPVEVTVFDETLQVARGFSRPFIFEFNDVDTTASPQPEVLLIDWGDGTESSLEVDWENIGVYDENDDPIPPQKDTLPGQGMIVGARAFDQNSTGIEVCVNDQTANNTASPVGEVCATSAAVIVNDVTVLTVNENSETDIDAEAAEDYILSIIVTNEEPSTWDGLTAENTLVSFEIPEGVSVVDVDGACVVITDVQCSLGNLIVGEEVQLDFTVQFDPEISQEQGNFNFEVVSTDDGPRLESSTTSDISVSMADNDDDDVINYFDAFPENPIYAVDSDEDGMPDEWEASYGFDANNASDASLDNDGDGANNVTEFRNSTSPFIADAANLRYAAEGGNAGYDEEVPDNLGVAIAGGDFNGDGHIDMVALAPNAQLTNGDVTYGYAEVTYGSESGLTEEKLILNVEAGFLLYKVATGDLNDDGYDDIVINSYRNVYVFLGLEEGFLTPFSINEIQTVTSFGSDLKISDVDGDNLLDLLIGSTAYQDEGASYTGAVHVYLAADRYYMSGDPQPAVTLSTDKAAMIGTSIGVADLDGDELVDIVVGGGYGGAGHVEIYLGSSIDWSDLPTDETIQPSVSLLGEESLSYFGFSLSTGEDIDGDNISDLVVGAYQYSGRGAVYVYQSTDDYLDATTPTASHTIIAQQGSENFGIAVELLPALTYTNATSVLIGSDQYVQANENSEVNHGKVTLNSGPLLATPYEEWTGAADSMFGHSLAYLGDIDSDLVPDFAIGAPALRRLDFDGGVGEVFVFTGGTNAEQSDIDSDNVADEYDNCPEDENSDQADVDEDGIGDVCDPIDDTDSDGDGVIDSEDDLPNDPTETLDSDSDGVGNNADTDDDNDGVADDDDAFPLDPARSSTGSSDGGGSGGGGGSSGLILLLLSTMLVGRRLKQSQR